MSFNLKFASNVYIVRMKHDGGYIKIRVAAKDEETAKRIVASAEGAPLSAVKSVTLVPKKNPIKRKKSPTAKLARKYKHRTGAKHRAKPLPRRKKTAAPIRWVLRANVKGRGRTDYWWSGKAFFGLKKARREYTYTEAKKELAKMRGRLPVSIEAVYVERA